MAVEVALRISFRDETVDLKAQITSESPSSHTGRLLREAESEVAIPADRSDEFKEAVAAALVMDEDGNAWSGRIRSESYNTGGGPHRFAVTWTERETLRAERVEFEGLTLTPTRYHEEERHGIVAVELQATLSPEEVTRVRELQARMRDAQQRYWYVTRVGVSAQPRYMRFGQLLWNKRADGNFDYQIVLVDAARDEHDQDFKGLRNITEPQLSNVMARLSDLEGRFEALLGLLEQGKPLDADARKLLDEEAERARRTRYPSFFEVDDVNGWWLHER